MNEITLKDVQGIESYAKEKNFIIAKIVCGGVWFHGACDEMEKAQNIANLIPNGLVLKNI